MIYEMDQLVRASHRYREVTGSNLVEVLFFQASLRNCKNCVHNCEDHSFTCVHFLAIKTNATIRFFQRSYSIIVMNKRHLVERYELLCSKVIPRFYRVIHFVQIIS